MGVPVCRIGDLGIGTCTAHIIPVPINVTILTGSPTVIAVGMPVATIGSIGLCSCGHMSVALIGASTVIATALGVHRLGDMGLPPGGSYNMIVGAPTVLAGL